MLCGHVGFCAVVSGSVRLGKELNKNEKNKMSGYGILGLLVLFLVISWVIKRLRS